MKKKAVLCRDRDPFQSHGLHNFDRRNKPDEQEIARLTPQ